ncbi:MAG: synthase family protein [Flaviaesturariibacter sp.]|nr:synthase family protein [Flaviaesturariibacter sp.]
MGDASKGLLLTAFLILLFFFFGSLHDFLKEGFARSALRSYKVLLPLLAVLCVLVCWVIRFKTKSPNYYNRYIRNLCSLLLVIEIVSFGYHFFNRDERKNDLSASNNLLTFKTCDNQIKPNIYFIVLDAYTSSVSLKSEFNFDNRLLDSAFQASDFFISKASQSNYNVTPFSLASTFSLNYLRPDLGADTITSNLFLRAMETFKHNPLTSFFKKQGYALRNYGCFEVADAPLATKPYFPETHKMLIDNQTLYARVQRDIGWNFQLRALSGQFVIPKSYREDKAYHIFRNQYNWQHLIAELNKPDEEDPKFVYAHLELPHEPFYLNGDGSFASDTAILKGTFDPRKGYVEQTKFANRFLMQLLPLVKKQKGRETVVVIEGDHGYKFFSKQEEPIKGFANLNAYYFSDGDYKLLYDGISPVNSFRVIFNKYFCQSLPLLRDSTVYLYNPDRLLK